MRGPNYVESMQRQIDTLTSRDPFPQVHSIRTCTPESCQHYRKAHREKDYTCHRSPKQVLDVERNAACVYGLEKKSGTI